MVVGEADGAGVDVGATVCCGGAGAGVAGSLEPHKEKETMTTRWEGGGKGYVGEREAVQSGTPGK